MKILLYIAFLGTNYCGYQIQPNGVTIQQRLNEATAQLFGYDCDIVGCSRTDSGVHANCFCATVSKKGTNELVTSIPADKIPLAIANYLPDDISVFKAVEVENDFHPRYDVKYKEYVYRIWNRREREPFLFDRSWHYPKPIDDGTVKKMNEAAKRFVGTHDFVAYMAADTKIKDTVRTITEAEVTKHGDIIEFRVCADGFLYNMVRILTGTLIGVAEGKIEPEDIDKITLSKDRKRAGITVPPCGLFLNKVVY